MLGPTNDAGVRHNAGALPNDGLLHVMLASDMALGSDINAVKFWLKSRGATYDRRGRRARHAARQTLDRMAESDGELGRAGDGGYPGTRAAGQSWACG